MKEIITKFDLEAAFKALDEVELPKVRGLRANRMDLSESTKRVDRTSILIEDYYDISNPADLASAHEEREAEIAKAKLARIEKIVDLDAETEEDILPTYVGKHIIQCPQCMTLFYKDPEDIVADENNPDVVNVNEICQHCGNDTGYTVIGKVAAEDAPIEDEATEETEVEETEEFAEEEIPTADETEDGAEVATEEEEAEGEEEDLDLNLEAEDIPEEEEEVEESLVVENAQTLTEEVDEVTKEKLEKEIEDIREKIDYYVNQIKLSHDENDRQDCYRKIDGFYKVIAQKQALIDGGIKTEDVAAPEEVELEEAAVDATSQSEAEPTGEQELGKTDPEETAERPVEENETSTTLNESKETVAKFAELSAANTNTKERTVCEQEDVCITCGGNLLEADGNGVRKCESCGNLYFDKQLLFCSKCGSRKINVAQDCKCTSCGYEFTKDFGKCKTCDGELEQVDDSTVKCKSCGNVYDKKTKQLKESVENTFVFIDISGSLEARKDEFTAKAIADGYKEADIQYFDTPTFDEPYKAAKENEANTVILYTGNDDYKTNRPELADMANVKVVMCALTEDADIKLELTDAAIDKMLDSPEFKKPISETEVENYLADDLGEDIDLEAVEDLNDKSINECISAYLTEVYSNVDNFVTTDCSIEDKKLIIEGTINFKSGKNKTTVFEFVKVDKNLFEGKNTDLAEGSCFRLGCAREDAGKMLLAESLQYSYKVNGTEIKGLVNNK